jgi:dipeptidase
MCDTLIHETENTRLFAKNSDRSPNEPNLYLFVPATDPRDATVACTYRSIPQVPHQNAVFLVKPSWMFGAEMGMNDHGVVIGNEAVFSRAKKTKAPALLGMDLLRLALERAASAREACDVIIELLQSYGQGGNGGFDRHLEYDNSFLIQDANQSFILEILGKDWAKKEVRGKANISNRMALSGTADEGSLPSFGFPKRYSEPLFTFFSKSKARHCRIGEALSSEDAPDVQAAIDLLSSHRTQDLRTLYRKGDGGSVCMHKSLLGDHTTASMIVERAAGVATIWLSNGSTPCLSLYLPTYFGIASAPVFAREEDALAFWLTREYLRRAIYAGWVDKEAYFAKRDELQKRFLEGDRNLRAHQANAERYAAFQRECATAEQAFVESHVEMVRKVVARFDALPRPWDKLTAKLGKRVFERDLSKRMKP